MCIRDSCYFYLATLFCRDYDVATAASTPGLPLQVKYEPKLSATQYPGRSSLEDTYKQILEDLEEAEERIETAKNGIADYDRYINGAYVTVNTAPKNCGNYITVDVVTALKARVALQMDDYENAAKYAGDPVSYTHLDVYKRQSKGICPVYPNSRIISVKVTRRCCPSIML